MRAKLLLRFFGTIVLQVSVQAGCALREDVDPGVAADPGTLQACAPDHATHAVERFPAIVVAGGEADRIALEARLPP